MKIKKYFKKAKTRVKALRVHPAVRTVEDVTLGTAKQIKEDSKKLGKGPSPFAKIPKKKYKNSKSYLIRRAVYGDKSIF